MTPLKIAITGSTGLVGNETVSYFRQKNYEILRILRPVSDIHPEAGDITWDIDQGTIDSVKLEGVDVVIHLAGANIAGRRWTESYKKEILESRVKSTEFLSRTLAQLKTPPKIFLCASAIGFYGNHPAQQVIDETSGPANDFLADVCRQWENAALPAQNAGIRVCFLRLGAVLSANGGALAKMMLPFKMGMGGVLGSGKQMFSWIALNEIPRIMEYLINTPAISGPVNLTAPVPVTNKEFTKVFGSVLKRPTIFPVPAFGARLLFGEMADALLLDGVKVVPAVLENSGYKFKYPRIKEALEAALTV